MLRIEPRGERAVRLAQREDPLRVFDRGVDLQSIADDARVLQQARAAPRVESRDALEYEVVERLAECFTLAKNRQPRQAGLIDLQDEPLEEAIVVADRKAVLGVVIWAVKRVARGNVAVAHGAAEF